MTVKRRKYLEATLASWVAILSPSYAAAPISFANDEIVIAQARSCKAVRSCEEAVILWRSGYRRADGDNDGIPCENVCRSKREVDEIRRRIGC